MKIPKVLIVDDEPDMLEVCEDALKRLDLSVSTEANVLNALEMLNKNDWALVLVDLKMPEMDGISFLKKVLEISPETMVCMITGYPTVETAVEAIKLGAYDYVIKPFTPEQIRVVVKRALEQKYLREENVFLRRHFEQTYKFDNIVGKSQPMQKIFELINQVAPTDSDVLLIGESGTGKELIARSIHTRSNRKDRPFVPVDCSAIPENLMESEFFGYEKGAFTDASTSRMGLLEFAHKGTFFLDEICELSLSLQAKLLRTLQERSFRRIGAREEKRVDVRVIAATNRDIDEEVKEKRFRADLYYRINVVKIYVLPLRERREDIELLTEYFVDRYSREIGKPIKGVDKDVKEVLLNYSWPGNVREFQNIIKRGIILTQNEYIKLSDIPNEIAVLAGKEKVQNQGISGFFELRSHEMAKFEREYLEKLLTRFKGDVSEAAKEAKLPKGTLYRFLKKYKLRTDNFRK
ncbi:MAG: sigma-54 dependent transcriptional regulator [Acidobacteriota bacterium]